jgi:hypothetical protein
MIPFKPAMTARKFSINHFHPIETNIIRYTGKSFIHHQNKGRTMRINKDLTFSILFLIILLFIPQRNHTQNLPADVLKINLDYASPSSEKRFKAIYTAVFDVNVSYNQFILQHVFTGLALNYSNFKVDQSKLSYTLNTKMHVVNPSLLIGYEYRFLDNLFIDALVNGGYSWVLFSNSDYPSEAKEENNSGFSVTPSLEAAYKINNSLKVGIQFSYKFIFCYFGKDLGYDVREDSDIRYTTYGLFAAINF